MANDLTVDERTRLARGGSLNLAGSLVNAVVNFGVILVITRGLGRGHAGAFFEATALFQILVTTGLLGADTGLARFLPAAVTRGRPTDLWRWTRVALVPVAVVGVVLAAGAFALSGPLGDVVADGPDRDDFVSAFRVLCLFVPLASLYTVLQTGTRAFGTMVPAVVVERVGRVSVQLAGVAVAVAAAATSAVIAWFWAGPYALAAVPLTVWFVVLLRRGEHTARRVAADGLPVDAPVGDARPTGATRPYARHFWLFAAPRAVAGVFQVAILQLDILLVGALASTGAAAVYAASGRWLVAGLFITLAVNQAFQPQISRLLARKDIPGARDLYQASTAWVVTFVWPIYLTIGIFGGVLVGAFGDGYQDGATVLAILAVAGMLGSGCGPVDMVLLMGGRSRNNLLNTVAALVVNVVANVLLVPRIGVSGAAVAWTLSIATTNGLALSQVWRGQRLHPFGPATVRIAPAALAVVGGILALVRAALGETVPALLTGIVLAGLAYLFVLRSLAGVLDLASLRRGLARRGADPVVPSAIPSNGPGEPSPGGNPT